MTTIQDPTTLYTVDQVAGKTGRTPSAIYRLRQVHGLGVKLGCQYLFTPADIAVINAIDRKGGKPAHKAKRPPGS